MPHLSPQQKKILIIDDHPLVGFGVKELLQKEQDLVIAGQARTRLEAIQSAREIDPDLIVLDISISDTNGLQLIPELKEAAPGAHVIVLSMHEETLFAERAIRAGAKGYVNKEDPPESLLQAIRTVLDGKVHLSEGMTQRLLTGYGKSADHEDADPLTRLSNREFQVFELMGKGKTTKEIAKLLHVSTKTVETHRESIKRKLHLKTNLEIVRMAMRRQMEME